MLINVEFNINNYQKRNKNDRLWKNRTINILFARMKLPVIKIGRMRGVGVNK